MVRWFLQASSLVTDFMAVWIPPLSSGWSTSCAFFRPLFRLDLEREIGDICKASKILSGRASFFRQRHQPVFVALGIADMNPHISAVNITSFTLDTLSKTQPHTVGGKETNPVTQPTDCTKKLVQLLSREYNRDSSRL